MFLNDRFLALILSGSREAAFTYAISSAGVAYAVTSACARGNISACGCAPGPKPREPAPSGWKWGGCSVDINFGMRFARKFMDARELEGDERSLMNLHNNKAGRKAVKTSLLTECKCHGVSGSCTMKTCWKTLPGFRQVGDTLMKKYYRARPVTSTISPGPRGIDSYRRARKIHLVLKKGKMAIKKTPKKSDLVFLQTSPNYCERDLAAGSLGTPCWEVRKSEKKRALEGAIELGTPEKFRSRVCGARVALRYTRSLIRARYGKYSARVERGRHLQCPRSPRGVRLPTVDRSPSRVYPGGSPLGRKPLRQTRSGNNSPEHSYGYHHSPYYRDEDLGSPMLEERGRPVAVGPGHHRSRSATRPSNPMSVRYQSLDRGPTVDHEREFLPIRDRRDRSLDRGLYFDDEPYSTRSARQSPTSHQPFIGELQHQNSDLQRELGNLKKELELTNQKLGSSMHSIKTFWSPELKKERALRKEESAKYSLINDQLKLLSSENQVSATKTLRIQYLSAQPGTQSQRPL
ncbi:hypothetical protein GEV33_013999 [Tenebrio molitor]|uniref:Protein Wnt n=1 Tax=Tenebrio molitor TaxID=7067 RepID=A0A8J6L7I6_TENMO|nr:hypothetical protein GEV33_013999 [Tenebrio molitor]